MGYVYKKKKKECLSTVVLLIVCRLRQASEALALQFFCFVFMVAVYFFFWSSFKAGGVYLLKGERV